MMSTAAEKAAEKAAADAAAQAETDAAAAAAAAEVEAAKSVEQRNAEDAARAAAEALAAADGTPPEKVKLRTYEGFTEGAAAPHDLYRLSTDDGLPGALVKSLRPGQRGWGVAVKGENVTGQVAATAVAG